MEQLSYLPFANTNITLYNKYQAKNATGKLITSWYRHIIPNCFRTTEQQLKRTSNIATSTDNIVVQIPMFDIYKEPYDYKMIVNSEIANYITVNDGDIIVLREVTDEIDDLTSDLDLLNKYGSLAFVISKTEYNYGKGYPLPHILVVGS